MRLQPRAIVRTPQRTPRCALVPPAREAGRLSVLGALLLAGSAEAGGLSAFEDCRLSAGPSTRTVKARCATLERPEDLDAPAGRTLALRVAVVPARTAEPRPDPLVLLAGGPGQAATDTYVLLRGAFERIRADRDILLLDQRGTGASHPLDCPKARERVEESVDLDAIPPAVDACLEELGDADPRHYTTSVAVLDLEAARRALGLEALNLYGISYGTRVAQHYLRRFPDAVRTVILDGVVPPTATLGPRLSRFADDALRAQIARCRAAPACRARFPALEARVREALGAAPFELELNHPTTGETTRERVPRPEVAGILRLLLYTPETAALLPLLVERAASGRPGPLVAQGRLAEAQLRGGLAFGMHAAVVCTEDVPRSASAGAPGLLGLELLPRLERLCERWPAGVLDADLHAPLESDAPALLLSGELDPVTPPAWGERAKARLTNALHVVAPEQGHGIAPRGCAPRLLARFVDTGRVDSLDASCLDRLRALPFFVDVNGPPP
jgi:pimeloyl-ACP methyl ester carboxylesterase